MSWYRTSRSATMPPMNRRLLSLLLLLAPVASIPASLPISQDVAKNLVAVHAAGIVEWGVSA